MLVEIATTVFHSPLGRLPFRLPPQQLAHSISLPEAEAEAKKRSNWSELIPKKSDENRSVGGRSKNAHGRSLRCGWKFLESRFGVALLHFDASGPCWKRGPRILKFNAMVFVLRFRIWVSVCWALSFQLLGLAT